MRKIKIPRNKSKVVKNLISENYKTLIKESESESHLVMSDSLLPHGLYSPWNSPGQNTGVGSRSFLQEIFPTQGSRIAGGFFTS